MAICYSILVPLGVPPTIHLLLWAILFILLIGIFILVYVFKPVGKPISNATLTCKHGHTCGVWINYSGRGWYSHDEHGNWGLTYRIGGSPTVSPETCPKCGAPWSIPNKHHESHEYNSNDQDIK